MKLEKVRVESYGNVGRLEARDYDSLLFTDSNGKQFLQIHEGGNEYGGGLKIFTGSFLLSKKDNIEWI